VVFRTAIPEAGRKVIDRVDPLRNVVVDGGSPAARRRCDQLKAVGSPVVVPGSLDVVEDGVCLGEECARKDVVGNSGGDDGRTGGPDLKEGAEGVATRSEGDLGPLPPGDDSGMIVHSSTIQEIRVHQQPAASRRRSPRHPRPVAAPELCYDTPGREAAMTTEQRLERLERQNRWSKRIAAIAIALVAAGGLFGCTGQHAPDDLSGARVLSIRWQRLVADGHQTCPRCRDTEVELGEAVERLERSLAPSNVRVDLEKVALDKATFESDPLASNRIWIAERPLEDWLEASIGKSPCCESCEDAECRTVRVGAEVYEAISADLIVRAGLRAASSLRASPQVK